MAYKLELAKNLRKDFDDIVDYYKLRNSFLGKDFSAALKKKFKLILNQPEAFPIYEGNFRKAALRKYPYTIYFEIIGDVVFMIALVHHSRGQEFIESRLH